MATRDDVIEIARLLPDHSSARHFDRLALKVGGKIFATLDSAGETVNLMLTPEDQSELLAVTDAARTRSWSLGAQGVNDSDPVASGPSRSAGVAGYRVATASDSQAAARTPRRLKPFGPASGDPRCEVSRPVAIDEPARRPAVPMSP